MERKYLIGENATLTDDGFNIHLTWTEPESGVAHRVGCARPIAPPVDTDVFEVTKSLSGEFYYLNSISLRAGAAFGFWLSAATWDDLDTIPAMPGILTGPQGAYARFSNASTSSNAEAIYYRRLLFFNEWSLKSVAATQRLPYSDPLVKDYFDLMVSHSREVDMRFEQEASRFGLTLETIRQRIGAWVKPCEAVEDF